MEIFVIERSFEHECRDDFTIIFLRLQLNGFSFVFELREDNIPSFSYFSSKCLADGNVIIAHLY